MTQFDGVTLGPRLRKITGGWQNHEHGMFSPDGKHVAYYAGVFGNLKIYVADVDGRRHRPVTSEPGNQTQAAWSPDGRWIAYRHQSLASLPWEIWRVNVSHPTWKEALLADPKISFKHPTYHPTAERIAYFGDEGSPGNYHVFTLDLATKERKQITFGGERNDCHPAYSPSGSRIAFHAYFGKVDASESQIFAVDESGGPADVRRVSRDPGFWKHPFFVDETTLTCHFETADGQRRVRLLDLDTGEHLDLTDGSTNDKHPNPFVTKKGKVRILFSSKRLGSESKREPHTFDIMVGKIAGLRAAGARVVGRRAEKH